MGYSLFSRLLGSYLAIFFLVMAVSVYAIIQLHRFDDVAQSVLENDHRILDYERKLSDALLSEVRYERKFFIAKDDALYDQFLLFNSDFDRYIEEAIAVADSRSGGFLHGARARHQDYQNLVREEVAHLKAGRSYSPVSYKRKKEEAADATLAELEGLRADSQQATFDKIRAWAEAAARARRMGAWITGASLVFIVVVSVLITRSITRPVSLLKRQTRKIAQGNFDSDLNLASPPEMAELAAAFNLMGRKLKDLDKMKSDFFASMSHELRTPLTSIKEGTRLLLDGVGGPVTGKQRRLLKILAEESDRLIGAVNSLLDLSKMEAGMTTDTFKPVNLAPLINKAIVEIGPLIEAKRIKLEGNISDGLPIIKADSERILQALRNLIGNAVKFTPDGGQVSVSAQIRDGTVAVSIADTGPGIPKETLGTIFEKYQQADPGSPYRVKGTGLGLALVKHIVIAHGGKVWAESEPGHGSTFTFVLPV